MSCETDRSPDNYFFGGDSSGVFAAGDRWQVPPEVWRLLSRGQVIYYRVVVVNHHCGTSEPSVDERHLDVVPGLRILHEGLRRV
ncbi:hypothetical protein [Pseudonocardia oroxyli]|nr:hypothetical protein [Pseudonocardia oroxyli]